MTSDPYQELPPAKRRRLIYRAVLRGLLSATVLVVLYYLLPDQSWNGDVALRVLAGLLVFAGITAWQVRTITGSRYPALKAAEALGLIFPLYLLVFASTYYVMERSSAANFTQPLTKTDALYFTVTVFSTVGFGDIAPKSEAARVVLIIQMLGDLALLGAGVRILLGAVRRGQQRRTDTGHQASPGA
jgi:voltage-gated potassium channel